MITVYSKYVSERQLPKNLSKEDLGCFRYALCVTITPTTVELLKCVDVLNDTIFCKKNLKFYSTYSLVHKDKLKRKLKKLLMLLQPSKKIFKAVWIIDTWSNGYFHWFTDALPRLIASEEFIDKHVVLLPMAYQKNDFIMQSLDMLNMQIEFYNPFERVHIQELILPSHTAPISGNYNKAVINKARNRFLSDFKLNSWRKIYISRQKAQKRKIVNEDDVVAMLTLFGYEIHFFEDYSFKEQLMLMRETKSLVSIHGAGLTNMLFMPKGGKVLELRNNHDPYNNCYFSLASDLEHDYFYLLNQGDTEETHLVNLTVDVQKLEEVLILLEF